jgi:hypothetical protein
MPRVRLALRGVPEMMRQEFERHTLGRRPGQGRPVRSERPASGWARSEASALSVFSPIPSRARCFRVSTSPSVRSSARPSRRSVGRMAASAASWRARRVSRSCQSADCRSSFRPPGGLPGAIRFAVDTCLPINGDDHAPRLGAVMEANPVLASARANQPKDFNRLPKSIGFPTRSPGPSLPARRLSVLRKDVSLTRLDKNRRRGVLRCQRRPAKAMIHWGVPT